MGNKKKTETTQTQNTVQNTTQNTNQSSSGSTSGQYANRNFYGEYTPTDTADIQAFRGWKPEVDPGLSYQYGNARNKLQQSINNPTGGYRTAAMDDAILRSGNRALAQDEAQAYRGGQYDVNQIRSGQLGSLAALTRPSLIQTGSAGASSGESQGQSQGTAQGNMTGNMTGTGTQIQSGGMLGDILGAGAQIGSAALM